MPYCMSAHIPTLITNFECQSSRSHKRSKPVFIFVLSGDFSNIKQWFDLSVSVFDQITDGVTGSIYEPPTNYYFTLDSFCCLTAESEKCQWQQPNCVHCFTVKVIIESTRWYDWGFVYQNKEEEEILLFLSFVCQWWQKAFSKCPRDAGVGVCLDISA